MAEITDWPPPKNEDQVFILPRLGSIEKRQATGEMLSLRSIWFERTPVSLGFRQLNYTMEARFT
jgi:hypothetical protein